MDIPEPTQTSDEEGKVNTKALMDKIKKIVSDSCYQPPEVGFLERAIWNLVIAEVELTAEDTTKWIALWIEHTQGAPDIAKALADNEHLKWIDETKYKGGGSERPLRLPRLPRG